MIGIKTLMLFSAVLISLPSFSSTKYIVFGKVFQEMFDRKKESFVFSNARNAAIEVKNQPWGTTTGFGDSTFILRLNSMYEELEVSPSNTALHHQDKIALNSSFWKDATPSRQNEVWPSNYPLSYLKAKKEAKERATKIWNYNQNKNIFSKQPDLHLFLLKMGFSEGLNIHSDYEVVRIPFYDESSVQFDNNGELTNSGSETLDNYWYLIEKAHIGDKNKSWSIEKYNQSLEEAYDLAKDYFSTYCQEDLPQFEIKYLSLLITDPENTPSYAGENLLGVEDSKVYAIEVALKHQIGGYKVIYLPVTQKGISNPINFNCNINKKINWNNISDLEYIWEDALY